MEIFQKQALSLAGAAQATWGGCRASPAPRHPGTCMGWGDAGGATPGFGGTPRSRRDPRAAPNPGQLRNPSRQRLRQCRAPPGPGRAWPRTPIQDRAPHPGQQRAARAPHPGTGTPPPRQLHRTPGHRDPPIHGTCTPTWRWDTPLPTCTPTQRSRAPHPCVLHTSPMAPTWHPQTVPPPAHSTGLGTPGAPQLIPSCTPDSAMHPQVTLRVPEVTPLTGGYGHPLSPRAPPAPQAQLCCPRTAHLCWHPSDPSDTPG